jgi:hypothetical protein
MTKANKIPKPDGIHYHVEKLPGDRGQLVADVVAAGRRADRYRFGTPAPLDSVRAAAVQLNRFPSPSAKPEARDRRSRSTPSAR